YDIHPALLPAVAAAAQRATRMGALPESADGKVWSATEDGVTLSVSVASGNKTGLVAGARYQLADGAPEITGVLEVFSATIEGLPLQEAADHGTVHACERLRQSIAAPLVKGIHTPASMGTAFRRCNRLIRNIAAQFRAAIGDGNNRNFWNPPLSRGWRLQAAGEQLAVLQAVVAEFCAESSVAAGSICAVRVEKARGGVIDFSEDFAAARKPRALMQLERLVRARTGEMLEIFMEELKDNNRIRRLGTAPIEDVA